MSPTVLRARGYRLFFFSREELRPHVHVQHADGEAKIWWDPEVAVARSHGLSAGQLAAALKLVEENEAAIRVAWRAHFGG